MSYAARFQNLDIYQGFALAIHRKQHWLRRARQEHINRSGACIGEHCDCPNCQEHRDVIRRARVIYETNTRLSVNDAWDRACYEITRGAAETPWSDPV